MTKKKDVEKHAVAGSRKMLKERLKTFEGELWIRYDDHRRECDEERRLGEARYKQEFKRMNAAEIERKKSDQCASWRCMIPECGNEPSQDGEYWMCPSCAKKLREKSSSQGNEIAEQRRKLNCYYDDRLREANLRKKAEKEIEKLNSKLDETRDLIEKRTLAVCRAVEDATRSAPMGFDEAISLIKRLGEIRPGFFEKDADSKEGEDPFEPLDQTARFHRMLPAYAAKSGLAEDIVLCLMNELNGVERERRKALKMLDAIDAVLHPEDFNEGETD